MNHYQMRFKTIPDENREKLVRAVVGMFPNVLDCLQRTGEGLCETWSNYVAPLKRDGHHVDSDSNDPTAYDADIRNTIEHFVKTIEQIETVLGALGMRKLDTTPSHEEPHG